MRPHSSFRPPPLLTQSLSSPQRPPFPTKRPPFCRHDISETFLASTVVYGGTVGFLAPELCFEGSARMRDPSKLATLASDIFALGETMSQASKGHAVNKPLLLIAKVHTHLHRLVQEMQDQKRRTLNAKRGNTRRTRILAESLPTSSRRQSQTATSEPLTTRNGSAKTSTGKSM